MADTSATITDIRAYEIVASLAHLGGVEEAHFEVQCSTANDRQPSNPEYEAHIDAIWKERVAVNPSLFDGTKFRFAGVHQGTQTSTVLDLGITSYKYFLGTNCAVTWHALDPVNLASPLGNAAIVETTDTKVVLLKRSQNVGECPDTIVCPGGHPEPEMVGIKSMAEWKEIRGGKYVTSDWSKQICHELFDAMVREVVEETGIPRSRLGTVKCIGFTERVVNKRPDIIFHIPCSITANEVHHFYGEGPEHKFESTELITMDREEFIAKVLDENSINMPGCHRGGVDLYREFIANQAESRTV